MSAADSTLDGDQLIASRSLSAPVELVWQALTTPEHLAAFWGGDHATIPPESVTVDLRVGGVVVMETREPRSGTPGHRLQLRYDTIDPPRRLVMVEPATGLETTIRLEPVGSDTAITIHQRRLPPELRSEQARLGLAGLLDALADHLARPAAPTARLQTVERYVDGFRRSDHGEILDCLTEDIVWNIHGVRTTHGKSEFDAEIESPLFEGSPELTVDRILESGDLLVATGTGAGHFVGGARCRFVFSDLFRFRGDLIAQVDSYVVPVD
nr:hypothetical protein [Aeromicrobium sp.]